MASILLVYPKRFLRFLVNLYFFSLKPSADPKMLRLIDAAVSEELGKKQTNTLTDTLDRYVY